MPHLMHATVLESGDLFLWAEDISAAVAGRGASHPFALTEDELQAALGRLLGLPDEAPLPSQRETLCLPTQNGRPLASCAEPAADERVDILRWRVPGCALRPSEAALLLARAVAPAEMILSPDFSCWSAAGRWTLALLARGRLVADLRVEPCSARVGWIAALDAAADVLTLEQLCEAVPASACCHSPEVPPVRDVIARFVNAAIDELARHWLSRSPAATRIPSHWPGSTRRWVEALCTGIPYIAGDVDALEADVRRWQRDVQPGGPRDDFRTGFRLEEPPGASESGTWMVHVFMQALDDPEMRVPAIEIWQGDPLLLISRSARLERGTHRLERPQEKLLADLGRALRVFPALERTLSAPRPAAVTLGLAEASQFVRTTAWLLQDAGFTVVLPSWATDPDAAPRLRLVTSSPEEKSAFGLAALLEYEWQVALGPDTMDPREFRRLAEQKIPLVRLRDKWTLVEPPAAEAMLDLWSAREGKALTLREALQLAAGADGCPPVDLVLDEALDDPGKVAQVEPPAALQARLRPYQRQGFSWLVDRVRRGLGACLADDMGLGKTVQMLALLLHEHEQGRGQWLLVCPMSLVGNWVREVERFAPSLRVAVHHGRSRAPAGADLVLTTYGLAGTDAGLRDVEWRGIVLDEAQNIKNHDSRQARGVRALRADVRIAMSGTPVENRLSDLWSIMDFLSPGLLGTIEAFRRRFAVPIERYGDDVRRVRLRRAVQPFLLRRVKTDPTIVPDLPEKLERKVYCPLTREQASLYEATVHRHISLLKLAISTTVGASLIRSEP